MLSRSVVACWVAAGAIFAGVLGWAAVAQQAATGAEAEPYRHLSNGGLNHSLDAFLVYGQPFVAEQVGKQGRTLTDGTNIVHFGHHAIYRDSAGRIRVEQPCGCAPDHEQMIEVYILDSNAKTETRWRVGGNPPKVATVTQWVPKTPETVHPPIQRPANASRPQPQSTTDELRDDVMDGVPVKVVRVTTVVPAGRSGNDRPITKTHTAWISDDLKVVLMEQWEDPRDGVRTVGLAQFERKEPDPRLFQPPTGYSIQTGKSAPEQGQ